MAKLSDLKFTYLLYMKAYRYRSFDWAPGAVLRKPLAVSKIAVVTTAAFYAPGQEPFDEKFKGGDFSYRILPAETDLASLRVGHKSDAFDPRGIEADRNVALPLDRLREMASAGEIGSVAPRHFSFMGSIPAPARLVSQTAPEAARMLQDDGVDAVLLTPV